MERRGLNEYVAQLLADFERSEIMKPGDLVKYAGNVWLVIQIERSVHARDPVDWVELLRGEERPWVSLRQVEVINEAR